MKLVEVPEWQKELAQELRKQESEIDGLLPTLPAELKAKSYVCLAYDWYRMGATQEGQELIKKAESICPGYFANQARQQMVDSKTFTFIMNSVALILANIVRGHQK